MSHAPTYRPKLVCRLCSHSVLTPALTLAPTPPANAFVREPVEQECFPLEVRVCANCGHAQLGHVVDAESLFRDYCYVSGTSPVFRKHFEDYAKTVSERVGLKPGELVCEIGSNDGTLLRCFPGSKTVGVEPAEKIARQANDSGILTLNEFFGEQLALGIHDDHGPARLILANNVMAHIDDLGSVLDGVKALLAADGLFVMEVQYVGDLLRDGLFDMIYFEHVDYHAVSPLLPFFAKHGLQIVDVEHVDTHGGSIRCYVSHHNDWAAIHTPRIDSFRRHELENDLLTVKPWKALREKIDKRKKELRDLLSGLKAAGRTIVGYGAPAKLTTLLYTFEIGADILDYVVEDSPLKIGLYTPGLHIPVRAPNALYEDEASRPNAILICAWNFSNAIIAKHPNLTGVSWITPLPELTVTP